MGGSVHVYIHLVVVASLKPLDLTRKVGKVIRFLPYFFQEPRFLSPLSVLIELVNSDGFGFCNQKETKTKKKSYKEKN